MTACNETVHLHVRIWTTFFIKVRQIRVNAPLESISRQISKVWQHYEYEEIYRNRA